MHLKNKDILSLLLSEIIEEKYEYIYKNIKYLNNALELSSIKDTRNITDILIEVDKYIIDIEAYTEYSERKKRKSLIYITKILSKYYNNRNDYKGNKKIIQINIILEKKEDEKYYVKSERRKYIEEIEIIEINIDREETLLYTKSELINKKLWCNLLRSEIDEIEEIRNIIDKMKYKKEIKERMKERMIKYMTQEYLEEIGTTWQDRINLDKADARDEGLKEGLKNGYHNGIKDRNITLAKTMLESNYKIEEISKLTGLSIEKIKNLSTNINKLINN